MFLALVRTRTINATNTASTNSTISKEVITPASIEILNFY